MNYILKIQKKKLQILLFPTHHLPPSPHPTKSPRNHLIYRDASKNPSGPYCTVLSLYCLFIAKLLSRNAQKPSQNRVNRDLFPTYWRISLAGWLVGNSNSYCNLLPCINISKEQLEVVGRILLHDYLVCNFLTIY